MMTIKLNFCNFCTFYLGAFNLKEDGNDIYFKKYYRLNLLSVYPHTLCNISGLYLNVLFSVILLYFYIKNKPRHIFVPALNKDPDFQRHMSCSC